MRLMKHLQAMIVSTMVWCAFILVTFEITENIETPLNRGSQPLDGRAGDVRLISSMAAAMVPPPSLQDG